MHLLILNTHPVHSQFIQKAFRYENIAADRCIPENLLKIWYGQYDMLIVPFRTWEADKFQKIENRIAQLGNIPILLTGPTPPPEKVENQLSKFTKIEFLRSQEPFHKMIEAVKRMTEWELPSKRKRLKIGDLEINFNAREVKNKQKNVPLRNKEFSLLQCFMENYGQVLTRTFLLERVWDRNTTILSNTVDVHVSRLRRKIEKESSKTQIVTIPCIGYKFITA